MYSFIHSFAILLCASTYVLGSPTDLLSSDHAQAASPPLLSTIHKRAASCQNGSYTAPIGLSFNVLCNVNSPANDLPGGGNTTAIDIYDCARQCSLTRAQCYGVSYNSQNGQCWLKNFNITTAPSLAVYLLPDSITHTAVVTPSSQIASAYDTDCPFDEASTQSTNDGMSYKVHCNRDIDGYNDDNIAPDFFPWHAISLSDCMNQCSSAHPLCAGVSFFPQMAQGYANCYPKTKMPNPVPNAAFVMTTGAVVHSGVANLNYGNNSDCKDNNQIAAADNTKFVTMCNTDRDVGNIDRFHVTNLQDCINGCATYSGSGGNCIGAVYDSMLTYGYNNCYLKNVTGTPITSNATQGYVFARLSTTNDTSSTGSGGSTSSSNAWIAGPVVGGLFVLAVIAAIVVILRRRKRAALGTYSSVPNTQQQHEVPNAAHSYKEMSAAPPVALSELPNDTKLHEVGGGRVDDEKFELAASNTFR